MSERTKDGTMLPTWVVSGAVSTAAAVLIGISSWTLIEVVALKERTARIEAKLELGIRNQQANLFKHEPRYERN